MLQLGPNFISVLRILSSKLDNHTYCIRGTTSLVLQGIDMNVDDIDVLCDEDTALLTNGLLKDFLVDPVTFKESDKFKSFFGKFMIDGVNVEFMGNWQIKNKNGLWSKIYTGSDNIVISVEDFNIPVTKIEDELAMFLSMGRFSAYQKIKKQLQSVEENHSQPGLFN